MADVHGQLGDPGGWRLYLRGGYVCYYQVHRGRLSAGTSRGAVQLRVSSCGGRKRDVRGLGRNLAWKHFEGEGDAGGSVVACIRRSGLHTITDKTSLDIGI